MRGGPNCGRDHEQVAEFREIRQNASPSKFYPEIPVVLWCMVRLVSSQPPLAGEAFSMASGSKAGDSPVSRNCRDILTAATRAEG